MATDEAKINLLTRIAHGVESSSDKPGSILSLSAAAYGARPHDEATVPTGFDPHAVALFESIVEGAYLVAKADGEFDDAERRAFERVVVGACGGAVTQKQLGALISDLQDQLDEDGLDLRVARLSSYLLKKEHAIEVLRVAALLADASEGVSRVEREVLGKIATRCGLDASEVDRAIEDVRASLASRPETRA